MLVIKIEVWPGGRGDHPREIGRAAAANVTSLSPTSDYVAVLRDDTGHQSSIHLADHRRDAGFWPLVARIAASHTNPSPPVDLEPRWVDLADKIAVRMYMQGPR